MAIDWVLWMNYGKQDLSAVILFALLCHFWVRFIYLLLGCSGAHLGFLFPALLLLLRLDALGLGENATAFQGGPIGGRHWYHLDR